MIHLAKNYYFQQKVKVMQVCANTDGSTKSILPQRSNLKQGMSKQDGLFS